MKVKKYTIVNNLIIFLMLAVLSYFTINISSNYVFSYNNSEVIYNGNKNSNKVSFMVNVYWGNEYIPQMLEVFKQYNVKTTFFVGGSWAVKYPDLLQSIYNDGHEIANHGYFHKDQDKLGYDGNYEEIKVTHDTIKELLGYEMTLFAPPSGAFNKATLEACKQLGYKTIMWTKDTIDWRDQNTDLIYNRATNVSGGSFVLAHPTEKTLEALPKILEYYKSNNLVACTVTENLNVE